MKWIWNKGLIAAIKNGKFKIMKLKTFLFRCLYKMTIVILNNISVVTFIIQKILQVGGCMMKDFIVITFVIFCIQVSCDEKNKSGIGHLYSLIKIGLVVTVLFLGVIDFFRLTEVLGVFLYTRRYSLVVKYLLQYIEPLTLFRVAMYLVWMIRDGLVINRAYKYLWFYTPIDPDDLVPLFVWTYLILNFPFVWSLYRRSRKF